MTETLLIIGAGREQVPAYMLAKEKGLTIVGTDMDPAAPALRIADHALIASTRNVEATLACVSHFHKNHPISGVMTIANDVPYTVAVVARALKLAGAEPQSVKSLTSKLTMKSKFQAAQVSTPDFVAVKNIKELEQCTKRFPMPFILKPSDGRGSRGVLLIDNTINLEWAFDHALQYCDNKTLIAEEFITGPQLSVEGMFVDGQYIAVAYADRNYDNLCETRPFIVEDGGVIASRFEGKILDKIRDLIERGAKSLGLDWGVVKADIVLKEDGSPAIIELAGRLSGNYLATHHIPAAFGINIVDVLIDASLGRKVDKIRLSPKWKKYFGVRYFFPPEGRIVGISAPDITNRSDVKMFDIYVKPGDIQPRIDSHIARAGTLMVEGKTSNEAIEKAEDLRNSVRFSVEPVDS